jgi:molybdopterin-guanine dinucleotide biosynthesis protein A
VRNILDWATCFGRSGRLRSGMYDVGMNSDRFSDVTAFILAGGNSTRMGTDKAFLELGGQTLLARAFEIAGSVAREVRIVGDAQKFARFGGVVEDEYRDRGPLGGIHAALTSSATELNLILAVDLPLVEIKFLDYLISQARRTHATVTIPRAAGGWQPLCAVYRKQFSGVAERALREGRNKIDALFAEVETSVVSGEALRDAGFSESMFQNLNTPDDCEAVKLRAPASR